MSTNRTVVTGGYIVSMDDSYGDLPNGAILIEDNRIVSVARDAEEFAGVDAQFIDAEGGIILPGMVDTHRHTWMALLRAISADDSLPQFLANVFYRYGAIVEAEDLGVATMVGALESLDAGVTSIFDCCDCVNTPDHANAAVESLKASGIRGVYAYGMQAYDFQPPGFHEHHERLKDAERLRRSEFSGNDDLL